MAGTLIMNGTVICRPGVESDVLIDGQSISALGPPGASPPAEHRPTG